MRFAIAERLSRTVRELEETLDYSEWVHWIALIGNVEPEERRAARERAKMDR